MLPRTRDDRYSDLLKELQEERAAALNRISRTLESLIDQLRDTRARLSGLPEHEKAAALREYRELRERARKYRWYLEVQREALGLRSHTVIDEFYRIPEPIEA
jgi:hypothetical protein